MGDRDAALTAAAARGQPAIVEAGRSRANSIASNASTKSSVQASPSLVEISKGHFEVEVSEDSLSDSSHADDDYTRPRSSSHAKRSISGMLTPAPVSSAQGEDGPIDVTTQENIDEFTSHLDSEKRKSILYAHPRTADVDPMSNSPASLLRKKSTKITIFADAVTLSKSPSGNTMPDSARRSVMLSTPDSTPRRYSTALGAPRPANLDLSPFRAEEMTPRTPRSDGSSPSTARSTTEILAKKDKKVKKEKKPKKRRESSSSSTSESKSY